MTTSLPAHLFVKDTCITSRLAKMPRSWLMSLEFPSKPLSPQELRPEENILATLKYAPHVTREKITPEEKSRIEEYWRDSTQAIPWKKTVTYQGKKANKEKGRPKTLSERESG